MAESRNPNESTAQHLIRLNRDLIALEELGLSLSIGLPAPYAGELRELNERLALYSGIDQSAPAILRQLPGTTDRYRACLEMLSASASPEQILDSLVEPPIRHSRPPRTSLPDSVPVVILILCYACLLVVCHSAAPFIEREYIDMDQFRAGHGVVKPDFVTQILIKLYHWMPYWQYAIPGGLALFVIWRWLRKSPSRQNTPNVFDRYAAQAQQLNQLTQSDVSKPLALERVSRWSACPLPPLLTELVETAEDREPTQPSDDSQNLQALSQLYRRQADHMLTLSSFSASASLILGALAVALVALLLFIPWTSLLNLLTTEVGM
ncbi:hypothetical protein SV7mr_05660 [Stieleria bergensis]|uniref:Type IV pilin biogenesis protein n=1 Tax=Stieleria bergensis TaxID=2528025 RepID=A0A517SPM0_9BACT|nr:hypothetical protein SV7mr_05660 [Planctomycetes bacterium SV_7m_r]